MKYLENITKKMLNEIIGFSLEEVWVWLKSLGFEPEIVRGDESTGDYVKVTDRLHTIWWFCADDFGNFDGWIEDLTEED